VSGHSSTHLIEFHSGAVVKRYRSWDVGQPEREWRALTLLDEHAPGLAPKPLAAELAADRPSITMSRLDGTPLTGTVTDEQADALAETITRVQEAIPRRVLVNLPARAGHPAEFLQQVRELCTTSPPHADHPTVVEALEAGAKWLADPLLDNTFARPGTPVFGTGDGNLANYLWDGTRIRLVDFEYSGRSDRAFELAEVVEHVSVWADSPIGLTPVLQRLEPALTETGRLRDCRRLLAVFWLLRLAHLRHDASQPPPKIVEQQSIRLLDLLN
jgi:hypothetical protein